MSRFATRLLKKSGLGAICGRHMQEAAQTPKNLCNCSSGVSNHKHAYPKD